MEKTNLFIGSNEIKGIKEEGNDFVRVLFDKCKDLVIKKKVYAKIATPEPLHSLEALQDRKIQPVMKDVIQVFLDYDLTLKEIDTLFVTIQNFVNEKLDYASANLWKSHIKNRPVGKFIPQDIFFERTIGDINTVLENTDDNEDKNSAKSVGTSSE